jgi:uncharacterized protein (DUF342 family)
MSTTPPIDPASFKIEAAADGMTATLCADPGAEVSAAAVIAKLKEAGIRNFDDGELIELLQNRKRGEALSAVVARGKAPVDARAGACEYAVPMSDSQTGIIGRVVEGTVFGTVTQGAAGADGMDVFGKAVPHHAAPAIQAGEGVLLIKGKLKATRSGSVRERNGLVSVCGFLEIYADDESLQAPLVFDGDVSIRKTLPEGRTLQIDGCLSVGAAIDAGTFQVTQWVHAKGGVVGRDKGVGTVGGDLWCRFISGARVSVGGDIHLHTEITRSTVSCTGTLHMPRGAIVGGKVSANGGVDCAVLGNADALPTVVEAGTDQNLRQKLVKAKSEMDAGKKRVAAIRSSVAPLMEKLKSLTPQQKEKATELLCEADELEESIGKALTGLAGPCEAALKKSRAEILVADMVFPGVMICFPGVQVLIDRPITGPVKIHPQGSGRNSQIVMERPDGKTEDLKCTLVADHFTPCIVRIVTDSQSARGDARSSTGANAISKAA